MAGTAAKDDAAKDDQDWIGKTGWRGWQLRMTQQRTIQKQDGGNRDGWERKGGEAAAPADRAGRLRFRFPFVRVSCSLILFLDLVPSGTVSREPDALDKA